MILPNAMQREDYWQIRWPLLWLCLSAILSALIFISIHRLQAGISAQLFVAQAQLQDARTSVNRIEEEEATIIEYIDRYEQIEAAGSIQNEDRLQFLEWFARQRAELSLFPIRINVDSQKFLPLQYPSSSSGQPVAIRVSAVDISMPLLHEDDLVRLLGALRSGPGLLQPQECTLTASNQRGRNYIYLAQHFTASCRLQWYTFAVQPGNRESAL